MSQIRWCGRERETDFAPALFFQAVDRHGRGTVAREQVQGEMVCRESEPVSAKPKD